MGAYFFPPATGVVRIYFVWEVRPYWAAFGLSHTNCMGFSAICFVWPKVCLFPKVDRGWQNYFDMQRFMRRKRHLGHISTFQHISGMGRDPGRTVRPGRDLWSSGPHNTYEMHDVQTWMTSITGNRPLGHGPDIEPHTQHNQ